MTEAVNFLREHELRPLALPEAHGLRAIGLALGKGPNALEVVIAESATPHNLTNLRNAWRARLGGRATPLLLVVLFDGKVALCGPGREHPPAFVGLDSDPIERICATALDEPDRHAALRFLRSVIPQLEPGVRPALRAVAEHLRKYPPPSLPQEKVDDLIEAIEAPWGARIERQIRQAKESGEGVQASLAIAEVVHRLGLEPFRAPNPLPPIEEQDIRLICWMGVDAAS